MEIHRIETDIRFVNQIGQTLSNEEKLKLEIALVKLSQSTKYDQVQFWGRIEGTVSNYYIALASTFNGQFEFPHKVFYYTSNLVTFQELPALNPEHKDRVEDFRQLFSGQPEKVLFSVTGEDGGEPPVVDEPNPDLQVQKNDDDSDVEIKAPPKNFTELDRLTYVVHAIEFDCAIVPVGAVRLTPKHELRYNDSFEGLTLQSAKQISNYQHYRAPRTEEKKQLISRDDALFHYNFFDAISDDQPQGQWNIQTDSSKYNVTIRNIQWPGFLGYHQVGTRLFGYAYFGDGIKNIDLAFQL